MFWFLLFLVNLVCAALPPFGGFNVFSAIVAMFCLFMFIREQLLEEEEEEPDD